MSRLKKPFMLALGFAVLCLVALTGRNASAAGSIKIGVILPLSGSEAAVGETEKASFQMAVNQINAKGGVKGQNLELIVVDNQGRPGVSKQKASELIKSGVVALVGGWMSSSALEIGRVAVKNKFPYVIHAGAADKLTEVYHYTTSGSRAADLQKQLADETDRFRLIELREDIRSLNKKAKKETAELGAGFPIFRINPPASEYNGGVEGYLVNVVKPKTAAILHEKSIFGASLANDFQDICNRNGISVVFRKSYSRFLSDYKTLITEVKGAKPDVVFMASYWKDGATLLRDAKAVKFSPKLFVGGGGGYALSTFAKLAGANANNLVISTLWNPSAAGAYANSSKGKNMAVEYHEAESYSAIYVIADALNRAASLAPKDVIAALSATNVDTAFGHVKFISYAGKTNQNKLPTYAAIWKNGGLTVIWPK